MGTRAHLRTLQARLADVPAQRRLRLLLLVIGLAGAVTLTAAAALATGDPKPLSRYVLLVLLTTLVSDATCVNLRVRHHVESYTWAELNLVIGVALLEPEHLVLTSGSVAVAHLLTRRSFVKVAFNTASYAVGAALAVLVTHGIGSPTWDDPVRSAVALGSGVAVFSWWNGLSTNAAIALSQGLPIRSVYVKGRRLRQLVALGNILLGLSVLALAHYSPVTLIAVPPLLGIAYAAYRSYLRVMQERDIWRHLEETSKEISKLDEREIAEVAVARAASLLDADEVEVSLSAADGSGTADVYAGTSAGVVSHRAEVACEEDRFAVSTYRRLPETSLDQSVDETCVIVPLRGSDVQLGVLRVRFAARVKLTRREAQLLRTFAHTISSSVQNARLYAEMRDQAARNEQAALHDALTGLGNRVLLKQRVQEALTAVDGHFALLLIDLDHFKEVNDTLGHAAGDILLCELADRLRHAVRPSDTVCRLGGDEFAVLLSDATVADRTAERLLGVLAAPIEVDGVRLAVEGSIGVACYPADGGRFEELLQRADVAMYQAKASRGSFRRYRSDRDASSVDRLSLVAQLRSALDNCELVLHFQPQLDLASGRAIGAEALVRWQHPERGLLMPGDFVPLIETSALVHEFTHQVLDLAVAEAATWHRAGHELSVAVNLSARNLDDPRLPDDVQAILQAHGLPAGRLVLEITETAILGDLDLVEQQMARLQEIGVVLSIDDFGTGHSSLAFLQRVAVHELKIDRSFIANILSNDNDAAITRATIHLAQSLGLRTVAEGVAEPLVLQHLIDLRCDTGQGYHWSAPVPAAQARVLLGVSTITLPEQRHLRLAVSE